MEEWNEECPICGTDDLECIEENVYNDNIFLWKCSNTHEFKIKKYMIIYKD